MLGQARTVAVFLPNWIGDVVMATPALRALRQGLAPEARLIGVVRPYVADVLTGSEWIDEYLVYQKRSESARSSPGRLIQQLRKQPVDTAILLSNSLSTAWLAMRAGIRRRLGYSRPLRSWLLTDVVHEPRLRRERLPRSAVDQYLDLVRASGLTPASHELELQTTASEEAQADVVWERMPMPDRATVVFNTGGAHGASKAWPIEYYAQLARQIVNRLPARVLCICGPAERESVRQLVREADHPLVSGLADATLSIGLSKACLRRADLLVSTDSGPRHVAAAFGVPTVALFGPTDPRWSANYNPLERPVRLRLPCSPCAKRVCPLGHHRCLRDLGVDRVMAEVTSLWKAAAVATRTIRHAG